MLVYFPLSVTLQIDSSLKVWTRLSCMLSCVDHYEHHRALLRHTLTQTVMIAHTRRTHIDVILSLLYADELYSTLTVGKLLLERCSVFVAADFIYASMQMIIDIRVRQLDTHCVFIAFLH